MPPTPLPGQDLSGNLDRDGFLRTLLRELAGPLQNVVRLPDAADGRESFKAD